MWKAIAGIGERLFVGAATKATGVIGRDLARVHRGQILAATAGLLIPILSSKTEHDPKERRKTLIQGWAITALTMGYRNTATQLLMSQAIGFAFLAPEIGRGVVQGMRTGLTNRTMAAVPFSMTQINTQQAYASMEYARSRMGSAYSTIGNEAAMFSARYLSR